MNSQSIDCPQPVQSYSLTPLQEGMLYDHMTASSPGLDIEQIIGVFPESIDIVRLKAAWDTVVARYDVLRTQFRLGDDGITQQEVVPTVTHRLDVEDVGEISDSASKARIDEYLDRDRADGFRLDTAPLSRVRIFLRGTSGYVMVWTFHHIILDGRSHARVLRDVYDVYDQIDDGIQTSADPESSFRQHVDVVAGMSTEGAEDYWRKRFESFETPTRLPQADVGLTLEQNAAGHDCVSLTVPQQVNEQIESLLEQHSLTKNSVLQTLWGFVLSRYTGERSVVFGSIRAGRSVSSADGDAVGMYISHVPTVVDVGDSQSLLDLAKSVRAQHLEVRAFEHVPLSIVQSWSGHSASTAMYDTLVMYDHRDLNGHLRSLGKQWENRDLRLLEQSRYPVTLLAHGEPTFGLTLRYDRRRFDGELMSQVLGHLVYALWQFANHPNIPAAEALLATEAERERILGDFNHTDVDYPGPENVITMFLEQVDRTPDAVALVDDEGSWSYAELSERSGSVAAALLDCGVTPDSVVGVMIDRSREMMAALLGVMRAGGAYMPLNPEDPPARLEFMIENASAEVVLAQGHHREKLEHASAKILSIDDALARRPEAPLPEIKPSQLAYVLYTSGSTGRPKGVMIEHRSICNRLRWMQDAFELGSDDRVLQKTPLTFDVSVWEVLWAILYGARIVLATPGRHRDPRYIVQAIQSNGITILHFVPSMLRHFLAEDGVESCDSLRCVICSGEALTADDVKRFQRRSGSALHNLYGPTEAAVDVSHWPCDAKPACRSIPIGRPIANTRLYVLDERGHHCPVGVPGELFIAGIQVARGYVNRPDLTGERFGPDYVSGRNDLMYQSGDRARWLPDGTIDFLGRCDFEVKLNGVRIDLQEIEAALRDVDEVDDAVVVLGEAPGGQKRLVAYYTARRDVTVERLRSKVREILPSTMVPSVYVRLDAIPLGSTGKVARGLLPEPPTAGQGGQSRRAVYRSELEETIASIWAQSLGVPEVRSDENFFDIGGQSMMLLAVHKKVEEAIGYQFPIIKSLEHTSVAALTNFLENSREANPRIARAKSRGDRRRARNRNPREGR